MGGICSERVEYDHKQHGHHFSAMPNVSNDRGRIGNVRQNFATALETKPSGAQNVPGIVYYSESGFEISLGGLEAGYAVPARDCRRRFITFPPGATIMWTTGPNATAAICTPQSCPAPSDATLATGPGTPTDPGTNTVTAVTDGTQSSVTVVWEVTNTNVAGIDSLTFNIYASVAGTPGATSGPNTTVASGYAPQLAAYSSSGAIPEFSSTVNAPTPVNLFTTSPCESISGQVTLMGHGLQGVAINSTGTANSSTTTDSSGITASAFPAAGVTW